MFRQPFTLWKLDNTHHKKQATLKVSMVLSKRYEVDSHKMHTKASYTDTQQLNKGGIKLNSVALVRERTIPTERPPLVGEITISG
jgi:hypothetical protein